ncbi:MAG: glycosyltransferase family 39 protein [Solirubrobacteraceae bacterium]
MSVADATLAPPRRRRRERAAERIRSLSLPVGVPRTLLALAFLAGLSLALRSQAIHARYWIDEGLSVGIASHPLGDIPSLLKQDGSPPLYYLLLGVWVHLFGVGEAHTHALSLVFALLAVPVAFFGARPLFGDKAAWTAALLAALCPYLTYYAQETRMYALAALLSLVVAGSFAAAFAQRRRRALPVFSLALALQIYTHNWGLFLGAGGVVALGWLLQRAPRAERRALLRDGALAYLAVALLYLPWLPTLFSQAIHTGAPWASRPLPTDVLNGLTLVLGGATPAMALLLGAGVGIARLMAPPTRSLRARAAVAIGIMGTSGIALAFVTSLISPAWANRYFASFVGPILLLAAAGLARAGRLGLVVLTIIVLFWFDPRTHAVATKSNAHDAITLVRDRLEDGDLVVTTHPEQGPLIHLYMPSGVRLRYADALGFVPDPRIFDWRDATDRLKAAHPTPTAEKLVDTLKSGQHLLLVEPILRTARWNAPWTKLVKRRSIQWERVLDHDKRLARTLRVPKLKGRRLPRGVRLVLFERY